MQVYSQKSTSTTLPRSASGVSGTEFTQRSALKAGSLPAALAMHDVAMIQMSNGSITLINGCSWGLSAIRSNQPTP